ncbi:MAG: hypothetical protein LBI92_00390 [Azoarcus sp.]|nr:hypothetical protein [Azoarcus sp.]
MSKKITFNDIVLTRLELYLGTPLVFFGLLAAVLWLTPIVFGELYEKFYLPYINSGPVILRISSGIFWLCGLPVVIMTLPILVIGFLRNGLKIDFSHHQKQFRLYIKIWGYTAIITVAIAFIIPAYIAERIEAKGYIVCHELDQFSLTRRVTGYVRHPMLCVSEDAQADALRIYKELHISHPNLFP